MRSVATLLLVALVSAAYYLTNNEHKFAAIPQEQSIDETLANKTTIEKATIKM